MSVHFFKLWFVVIEKKETLGNAENRDVVSLFSQDPDHFHDALVTLTFVVYIS